MEKSQRLPMLSVNGRKLILTMSQMPQTWLTAEMLAKSVKISRRTVLRELPGIEHWMSAAGFSFLRRPGQGILLDEGEENRQKLLQLLEESGTDAFLPKKERRQRLLAALFAAREPVKSYALAHDLMISERTLKSDLDQLEQWLQPYDIHLCRRPGVGVWLEGTPEKLRRGIGNLCQNSIPKEEMQSLLQGTAPEGGTLSSLLDPAVATAVLGIVKQFEREENIHFTDSGFLSLTIHIILTIQQLQNGIVAPSSVEVKPARMKQALKLARQLSETFQLSIPASEAQYLALYLDAYQPDTVLQRWDCPEEWHIRHLASTLISGVEAVMEVDLSRYPTLADDLCCHLHPMFHRIAQGIHTENPQMQLIQEQYPRLWNATRTACDLAQEQLGLPPISDEEAAFLAMHFGAIIEQETLVKMRMCAVVVCHYGMASCRFLISQLLRDFPVFHVSYSCSVRELDRERLEQEGIDLIISTIPLQIDFPCLCINPILQEQDRVLLRDAIAKLQQSQKPALAKPKVSRRRSQSLQHAGQISTEILELLDTMVIESISVPQNRAGLIHAAARLFCPLSEDWAAIEQKLWKREELGDTYIKPLRAVLLHCKTDAVSGCRLGYLKAEPPVYEGGKIILGALVLLAPENGNPVQMEVMQGVSALLIEEPKLIETFRSGDRGQAAVMLERSLIERFQNTVPKNR